MIKLSEIVHTIRKDKDELENDLTALENWRIVDSDFLTDMGFQPAGITHFEMKNPNIVVYHQKNKGFVVDDKSHNKKTLFPKFVELIDHFSNYKQKFEKEPYN